MICRDVIQVLEELAPPRYACSWDNVGLLVGRREKEVKKILVALDVTDEVVKETVDGGYDLLVTHHPMIFKPISRINDDDYQGRWLLKLLANDISCYAMHTNFDVAPGCMADLAAERLGLLVERPLEVTLIEDGRELGIGRIGTTEERYTIEALCEKVKEVFDLPFVTLYATKKERLARRIAISPGSGKGMTRFADAAECDVLISGDFGHHDGLDAMAAGVAVINAGHYGLEHIFQEFLPGFLREKLGEEVEVEAAVSLRPEHLL